MPVPSEESERSCVCVLKVEILLLFSVIFLLDFGMVQTKVFLSFY